MHTERTVTNRRAVTRMEKAGLPMSHSLQWVMPVLCQRASLLQRFQPGICLEGTCAGGAQ